MRHSAGLVLLFICSFVLAIFSARSLAYAARPALHWVRARGAEGCIDPIALAQRIEAFTGPVFVAATAAELSLTGEAAPEGTGFRVRIALSGVDGRVRGERLVHGRDSDCRKLDPAIAFIMALTLDPSLSFTDAPAEVLASFAQEVPPEETLLAELSRRPAPDAAAAVDETETPPAPPPPAESAAVPLRSDGGDEARTKGVSYQVGVGVQALGLVLPGFAPGGGLSFGLIPVRWLLISLGFEFAFGVGSEALAREGHARFRALAGVLRACPRLLSWQRLALAGCLGVALSQLTAKGSDFRTNYQAKLSMPALHAGLLAWLSLPAHSALWLELGARARLVAQGFNLRTSDGAYQAAYRPGPVGLQIALGAGYTF